MATITKNQIRPRSIKAVLTNAEVLTLPTAAVILVAASATLGYIFKRALLMVNDAAGAYTNVDAAAYLRFGLLSIAASNFGSQLVLASDGLIGSGIRTTIFDQYAEVTVTGNAETALIAQNALASTDLINQPLVIGASNAAAGNFTGGDVANTFTAWVWYDQVTLA